MSSTQNAEVQATQPASSLSFAQGFILGQLSIVLLIGTFIKFFVFGEAPPPSSSSRSLSTLTPSHKRSVSFTYRPSSPRKPSQQQLQSLRNKASTSHILRQPPPSTPATILRKTYYNVQSHQPESLDWFNVLVAQAIAQLRTDALADNAVLTSLTALLNGPRKPDFLESVAITEVGLGEDFPIFSNCRVHPVEDEDGSSGGGGRLQARMDVDLSDFITLGIETTLVLNYPRPRIAVLPVALSVSVARFSGTLAISFLPASSAPQSSQPNPAPPSIPYPLPFHTSPGHPTFNPSSEEPSSPSRTPTTLSFSFQPNYTLQLSTRSLLGARSRLQDVPKIAHLVKSQLRTWFEERCVAPRTQQIVVPSLWPRMKNVVGGGEEEVKGGTGGVGGLGSGETAVRGEGVEQDLGSGTRDSEEDRLRTEAQAQAGRDWEGLRWRGPGSGTGSNFRATMGGDATGDVRTAPAPAPPWQRSSPPHWNQSQDHEPDMPGPMPGTLVS